MKKILFPSIIFIFSSCTAELVEAPKRISSADFYNDVAQAESAINAIYFPLKTCFSAVYLITLEASTDYFIARDAMASISEFQGLEGQNRFATEAFWDNFYLSIRNANLVINNVPKGRKLTDEKKDFYVAEARFLRALCYFHLVRVWGRLPLRTDSNMDVLEIPRSSVEDVYQLILSDLAFAENYLDDTPVMEGRASKWAAKALLAEVYFYSKDYVNASLKAKEIIDSETFSLVEVNTAADFDHLFSGEVLSSSEEIFYIHYNRDLQWVYPRYLLAGASFLGSGGYYMVSGRPELPFYLDWDDNDLRKQYCTFSLPISGVVRIMSSKFRDPGELAGRNDYPLHRYADILLLYAEASCIASNSPTPDGVEKFNMIKRRAYGFASTESSPVDVSYSDHTVEEFVDLVIRERGFENFSEGKRWFDLKRANKLKEYIKTARNIDVADRHMLWPLPSSEMNFNKAIDPGDQNPGY